MKISAKKLSLERPYIHEIVYNIFAAELLNVSGLLYFVTQVFMRLLTNLMMRVLNVAEKNDAAKRIAEILAGGAGNIRRKEGKSPYNKIYEFQYKLNGRPCDMAMTSVAGHLLNHDFPSDYRGWNSCNPTHLFDAPVVKMCPDRSRPIKETLEALARSATTLIIWTDCDREGENIGFEIITTCRAINPRLDVLRAKFSEITSTAINRAMRTLGRPDENISNAVDVRSELDLRIGAVFTRFQSLRLQRRFNFPVGQVVSYGSCQFPTLGFVVERYRAIQEFVPEPFWKIQVNYTKDRCLVEFKWSRVRLFNEPVCVAIHEHLLDNSSTKVLKVTSKPKTKWRPVALDTVEFEKLASRKLRISAKESMKIAEKLYTSGLISYPRTETNIFPKGLDLGSLVEQQTADQRWGDFAANLLNDGVNPRNGKKSDQAHPPIHPTRFTAELHGNEARIYELIVRHFLACCSKDAVGHEVVVDIEVGNEYFSTSGLTILERNYLDVYPYDKWSDKELPNFREGEEFDPDAIVLSEGVTSPPNLLTEADLISLMEKHGIGTDATHAEHIETIKTRGYVGEVDSKFIPGSLGMGLVEGYDAMGLEVSLSKPNLRAELEADLKKICEGTRNPDTVLREQLQIYKEVFMQAEAQASRIDAAISKFITNNGPPPPPAPANRQNNVGRPALNPGPPRYNQSNAGRGRGGQARGTGYRATNPNRGTRGSNSASGRRCRTCNQTGHNSRNCPTTRNS